MHAYMHTYIRMILAVARLAANALLMEKRLVTYVCACMQGVSCMCACYRERWISDAPT